MSAKYVIVSANGRTRERTRMTPRGAHKDDPLGRTRVRTRHGVPITINKNFSKLPYILYIFEFRGLEVCLEIKISRQ